MPNLVLPRTQRAQKVGVGPLLRHANRLEEREMRERKSGEGVPGSVSRRDVEEDRSGVKFRCEGRERAGDAT